MPMNLIAMAIAACLASGTVFGQAVASTGKVVGGQPDIEGIWTNQTLTPFERPKEFAGKPFFTREEAAAFEKRFVEQRNADRRDGGKDADLARAYNDAWWDWGTKVAKTMRTSMVVDPPDGRVPPYTPEAQKRIAARNEAIKPGFPF